MWRGGTGGTNNRIMHDSSMWSEPGGLYRATVCLVLAPRWPCHAMLSCGHPLLASPLHPPCTMVPAGGGRGGGRGAHGTTDELNGQPDSTATAHGHSSRPRRSNGHAPQGRDRAAADKPSKVTSKQCSPPVCQFASLPVCPGPFLVSLPIRSLGSFTQSALFLCTPVV